MRRIARAKLSEQWENDLRKIMSELKSKNETVQMRAAEDLVKYVETQERELAGTVLTSFINDLNRNISELVKSNLSSEKLGGIRAMYALIDRQEGVLVQLGLRIDYLDIGLSSSGTTTEKSVMELSAKAIGQLSRGDAIHIKEMCNVQVAQAIDVFLENERNEARRLSSILVLAEVTKNAPVLFYPHLRKFLDIVWRAVTDGSMEIKTKASEALSSCLEFIAKRETGNDWFSRLYNMIITALNSLKEDNRVQELETIQGLLIVLGELLAHSGEFMHLAERFKVAARILLDFKDHKDKQIRCSVITLLPRLAMANNELFSSFYLNICMDLLCESLKQKNREAADALIAIGGIAIAVKEKFNPYFASIIPEIRAVLTPSTKKETPLYNEALECIRNLSTVLGPENKIPKNQVDQNVSLEEWELLLEQIFDVGLREEVILTLETLKKYIPSLLVHIQNGLKDLLTKTLSGLVILKTRRTHRVTVLSSPRTPHTSGTPRTHPDTSLNDRKSILLALRTLGFFELGILENVDDLLKDIVVNYLEGEDPEFRKQAAIACVQLLVSYEKEISQVCRTEVLEKLLITGIADSDPEIRQTALNSLKEKPSLDPYLTEVENLRSLFIALNDEVYAIRELAVTLIGRLSAHNLAYVMPLLRKTVIHLLTELELGDVKAQETSIRLIAALIQSSLKLMRAYAGSILKALQKFLQAGVDSRLILATLAGFGELSVLDEKAVIPYIPQLMPVIIQFLQDQSSTRKRQTAVHVLQQLASSTGYVIDPYMNHPQLLNTLIDSIATEKNRQIKRGVIKAIGILGAIDPYTHKLQSSELDSGPNHSSSAHEIMYTAPEYYLNVAITSLTKILRDHSLRFHHRTTMRAIVNIMRHYFVEDGLKDKNALFKKNNSIKDEKDEKVALAKKYLAMIMPPFIEVISNSEHGSHLFRKLRALISIAKEAIRDYLDQIFQLIHTYWTTDLEEVLDLLKEISRGLSEGFKVYVPDLIPLILPVLHSDSSDERINTRLMLQTLVTIGTNLDEYKHLIAPAIVNLFDSPETPTQIRLLVMETLRNLCAQLDFSEYASRIVHPITRLLQLPRIDIELKNTALHILCHLIYQLGNNFAVFIPVLKRILAKQQQIQNMSCEYETYFETMVTKLLKNQQLFQSDFNPPNSIEEVSPRVREEEMCKNQNRSTNTCSFSLNEEALRKAWNAHKQTTKEDWVEWMRECSVILITESPEPAIRYCVELAKDYYPLVRELFNDAFISCWQALPKKSQNELLDNFRCALTSDKMPPEILQMLLQHAEFLEHTTMSTPLSVDKLSELAESCHAYAKALHYKELDFQEYHTDDTIEALISLNTRLHLPHAADGILRSMGIVSYHIELKYVSWYEKLHRWSEALQVYDTRQEDDKYRRYLKPEEKLELRLGQIRCLHAMGEWERLLKLTKSLWKEKGNDAEVKTKISPMGAKAAWNLMDWRHMTVFVNEIPENTVEGSFYRAILDLHHEDYDKVRQRIEVTRDLIEDDLTALVAESYIRAYDLIVRLQQLSEMDEVAEYKQIADLQRRQNMKMIWKKRLYGCQRSLHTWQCIMAVRRLVLSPQENVEEWLKYASIARKAGNLLVSHKTLSMLLGKDPAMEPLAPLPTAQPVVTYAYIKQLWAADSKNLALQYISGLRNYLTRNSTQDNQRLLSRVNLKLGEWKYQVHEKNLNDNIPMIIAYFSKAKEKKNAPPKVWQAWAQINFQLVQYYDKALRRKNRKRNVELEKENPSKQLLNYVVSSVRAFFTSISLTNNPQLRDVLRLLRLLFKYGDFKEVSSEFQQGFSTNSVDTWLQVIPQIIARMDSPTKAIQRLIKDLLSSVGREHPQALVYPLSVAHQSHSKSRQRAAQQIMSQMRRHSERLLDQVVLVTKELIRVAVTWLETWYEGLREASEFFFKQKNIEAMMGVLKPLHHQLNQEPSTLLEISFYQQFISDLKEAELWINKYAKTNNVMCLNQAWSHYYQTYCILSTQIPALRTINLKYASPALVQATGLDLAVPGTYNSKNQRVAKIQRFQSKFVVISSKQRPRRLVIVSDEGVDYQFLLKGNEDLRQDERVMQLFDLVNNLLQQNRTTANYHLSIRRYHVVPLSQNTGLIGWVPNADTLHDLIMEYRTTKVQILVKYELMCMKTLSNGNYDFLRPIQKVEIFTKSLQQYPGNDLRDMLWYLSPNSEAWLERRTNYTRTLAVMSMVGYILGLGDRHPRNIMIERNTGHVVHIDFGDCFEITMDRNDRPEKVPFRLTRMLVKAMEVSGIEGSFRTTCELVMTVLRQNRDSLMAVLEAFVHDPLINWRLMSANQDSPSGISKLHQKSRNFDLPEVLSITDSPLAPDEDIPPSLRSQSSFCQRSYEGLSPTDTLHTPQDQIHFNKRAIKVISRVKKKLTGADFKPNEELTVEKQVFKLIEQATKIENLCQGYYEGWSPFY